jgi:probable HAF family extracellular repeat protein
MSVKRIKDRSLAFVTAAAMIGTAFLLPQPGWSVEKQKAPSYSIRDLGPLSTRTADDKPGLNAEGEVAAWHLLGRSWIQATLIKGAKSIDLGELPGFENTFAAAINNKEMIVGLAQSKDDMRYTRAFLWHDGKLEDLPTLGGKYDDARAINQQGDIAGKAQLPDSTMHAALWSHAKVKDLGSLSKGHFSEAHDINKKGEVVGQAEIAPDGHPHAFFWSRGHMQDLGLFPTGSFSNAQAINDQGKIVGYADTQKEGVHAVLWSQGRMIDLGTLTDDDSLALDINDAGQIVGGSFIAEGQERAFLWEKDRMFNLNKLIPADSQWILLAAYRINSHGEIIGRGYYKGAAHLFFLEPKDG